MSRNRPRLKLLATAIVGCSLVVSNTGQAAPAKPRVCVVAVTVDEKQDSGPALALRRVLENALRKQRKVKLIPHKKFVQAAAKAEIEEAQRTETEALYDLASALELDVALMVWRSKHDKRHRLLVAAVDPYDSSQLATSSSWLKRPRLSVRQARKVLAPLLREVLTALESEESQAPPPPPPGAEAPAGEARPTEKVNEPADEARPTEKANKPAASDRGQREQTPPGPLGL